MLDLLIFVLLVGGGMALLVWYAKTHFVRAGFTGAQGVRNLLCEAPCGPVAKGS